jgi:hypothetical protein
MSKYTVFFIKYVFFYINLVFNTLFFLKKNFCLALKNFFRCRDIWGFQIFGCVIGEVGIFFF